MVVLLAFTGLLFAQSYPSKFTPELARRPEIKAALANIDANRDRHLAEWIRLTGIPAPSRLEQRRGAYVKAEMEKAGLGGVRVDEIGNVEGTYQGSGGGPAVVFAAHMDTVFPEGTDLKVRRDGGILRAPGVFDNSASVANLLAAIRALTAARVRTRGDVIFIATTQEEIGLRGMRHWLERNRSRTGLLVGLDSGLGSVLYGALGIHWVKFIYTSDGSHTNLSRGRPNPARAIARAIQNIYTIPLPAPGSESSSIYNAGMIGGGGIFNAISQESFFTVDIRSNDPAVLKDLVARITRFAEQAARDEGTGFRAEIAQDSPAAGTARQLESRRAHPIVQTAIDVQNFLDIGRGKPILAVASGSTDANIGVEMGIPSIAVGRAYGGDQHTLQEWAEIDSAYLGAKQIVLLAAALAEAP